MSEEVAEVKLTAQNVHFPSVLVQVVCVCVCVYQISGGTEKGKFQKVPAGQSLKVLSASLRGII